LGGGNGGVDELAAQMVSYRQMLENVADVIIRGNAERRRTYVSPAVRTMLGYEPAEMMYGGALDLVHPADRERAAGTLRQLSASHPRLSLTFRMRRKDDVYIWVEARYVHVVEDGGVIAVLRDITDRKSAEDMLAQANARLASANLLLQEQANKDGLTGLANRRCLDERLAQEFGRARRYGVPLAVVLIDIDYFKYYNDEYGHLAGDLCLCRVSDAVRGVLRRPGDFAGRYGGEEILVLLPVTDQAGACHVAENLCNTIAALCIEHRGSRYGVVTVSAGYCAHVPIDDDDKAVYFIQAADEGLYAAKAAGRNQAYRGSLYPDAQRQHWARL
jgi:diguanylate cyclase (GGDEF)-like protein/PAS domain S-box-containing protein